jgi:hypothetical protein
VDRESFFLNELTAFMSSKRATATMPTLTPFTYITEQRTGITEPRTDMTKRNPYITNLAVCNTDLAKCRNVFPKDSRKGM